MADKIQKGHGSPVTLYDTSDNSVGVTGNALVVSGTVIETAPAATTFAAAQVTASATEVLLLPLDTTRMAATLANNTAINVYLGPTGVTAVNGFILAPGMAYNIDFPNCTAAVYGLAASGNPVISRIVLS